MDSKKILVVCLLVIAALLSLAVLPSNDDQTDAYIIGSLPYTNTQSTVGMTLEAGEPVYTCGWNLDATVWYSFTPAATGLYSIDTFGSTFDTVIHVYEDTGGGLIDITCDDDDSNTLQSRVVFTGYAGTTYLISIGGYNGLTGNLTLNVDSFTCPATSLCVDVVDAAGYPADVRGYLVNGTTFVANSYSIGTGILEFKSVSGTYELVLGGDNIFYYDPSVSTPGTLSVSAASLPAVDVWVKNRFGTAIDSYVGMSKNGWGFTVGFATTSTPATIYATAGLVDLAGAGWIDPILLVKKDQTITGGATLTLDGALMPLDTLTMYWDGATSGYVFGWHYVNFGFWEILDGGKVYFSVPSGDSVYFQYDLLWNDVTWDHQWEFQFGDCCYSTYGDANYDVNVGGTLSFDAETDWNTYYAGESGQLRFYGSDEYGNWLDAFYHYDYTASPDLAGQDSDIAVDSRISGKTLEGPAAPEIAKLPPGFAPEGEKILKAPNVSKLSTPKLGGDASIQGAWADPVSFKVKDAANQIIPGMKYGSFNHAYDFYYFDVISPVNSGTWTGYTYIDLAPYQSMVTTTKTFQGCEGFEECGWYGGVLIESDRDIVSVGRPHIGTAVAAYSGFLSGSTTQFVPMLFKNAWGSYNSALYVQNLSDTDYAMSQIKFYDTSGSLSCTYFIYTDPLSSDGLWLPSIGSWCLPDGWYGGAVITSDQNIVAVGRPHVGSQVMTYNGFSSGSGFVSVPMLFKNKWGYDSAFYIQNVDDTNTASVTIKFYDSGGNLNCTMTDNISPFASKGYWLPHLTCLPSSWVGGAVITSSDPIVAVGRPHLGSEITTYNGFAGGNAESTVPMLFKNEYGGSYNSALYIQNLDDTLTAEITMFFYDPDGNLDCTMSDDVLPLSSNGYWMPLVSCLPPTWQGSVQISSNQPVTAIGRAHLGSKVAAYNGFGAGNVTNNVPMLFKEMWGTYNSALYVRNLDPTNPANILLHFIDAEGRHRCTAADIIPANGTSSFWLPDGTCVP